MWHVRNPKTERLLDVVSCSLEARGLAPWWNVTDSHRNQDFLIVSRARDRFQTNGGTSSERFIGQQLPYPRKRAVLSKGAGSSLLRRGLNVTGARGERCRTNKDVRCLLPFSPFEKTHTHAAIQPVARWKRSHLHPFCP